MLVELQTGAPLFPGASDVDQLWRSLCCLCSPSFGYAAAVSHSPMFAVSWAAWHGADCECACLCSCLAWLLVCCSSTSCLL